VRSTQITMLASDKYFDDADKFIWKRWLNNDPNKIKEDAAFIFAPFSAGGRNCIGQHLATMEVKILLA